ncbi:ADP-ribose glycohydrolase ARH3 [Frankliniella fusca]|uniref:ADP-ribosylhydrolase ARH3 n=1 Tax=Frankliniella fusca TaxID=407009 RepID=A0AAE1LQ65_9NEOP|nr:ADP-ribose glycohydrolase ARH3 [Frankliniella fusca]
MAMSMSTSGVSLLSKFRGCLAGALLGDCFGAPFEFQDEDGPSPVVLNKFFAKLEGPPFKTPKYAYTDDTAMTKCIAQSFVERANLDERDLAKRFVTEFYTDTTDRGYGASIGVVFRKLREQQCADPMKPASEQFDGRGSYGNGGAMRISPVPLFCFRDQELMVHVAKRVTQITHTNPLGVNGAILQCLAIHQGLILDPSVGPLDVHKFADELIAKMEAIEVPDEIDGRRPYNKQLHLLKKLLEKEEGASHHQVRESLGNDVDALHSVPTAIYSFLRAQKPIPNIETDNKFRRTVHYAISLGGDTDTIASMAGAIAGAYFGEEEINNSYSKYCEYFEEILELANGLYEVAKPEANGN